MIDRAEISRSLKAAWRVLLNKPDAMRGFDTSIDGFWRSFQAILLVAPFYLVIALGERQAILADAGTGAELDDGNFWLAQVVTLVADWVTLPLLLAAIAGFIGVRREYPAFIVARNWATPIMVAVAALATLIDFIGNLGPEAALFPALIAFGFSLRFSYVIARQALGFAPDAAIAIVVLDFLVSFGIVRLVGKLFGVEI